MKKMIHFLVLTFMIAVWSVVSMQSLNAIDNHRTNSVSGVVFNDLNHNGTKEADEPYLDFLVTLTGPSTHSTVPDINGFYSFTGITPGTYQLTVQIPSHWTFINTDYTGYVLIDVSAESVHSNINFAAFNLVRPTSDPENITLNGMPTGLDNTVRPGSPGAPQQTAPVSPNSRLFNSIYITAALGNFAPDTLYVRKNQVIPMYMTSVDNLTHVLLFSDPELSAIAIGVGPGETRAITWKAYNLVPGQTYPFHCDVPGHLSQGERGALVVLSDEYPTVDLTYPTGFEELYIGNQYQITWTSSGSAELDIQLSTNNGVTWSSLNDEPVEANLQQFTFTVPNTISNQCLIRLIDVDYLHIYDVMDNPFMISPEFFLPEISVTPNPIQFDTVYLSDTTPSINMQIQNVGYLPLRITSWSISNHASQYNVTYNWLNTSIYPGNFHNLLIDFTPANPGVYRDTLWLYSNAHLAPVYAVELQDTCLYVPPTEPMDLTVNLDGFDMLLNWTPVTQDIYNNPISVSYYFLYGSNVPDPEPINQVFLGYSTSNSFRHLGVNLPGTNVIPPRNMFYTVTAVVWYPDRQRLMNLSKWVGTKDRLFIEDYLKP